MPIPVRQSPGAVFICTLSTNQPNWKANVGDNVLTIQD
jgi:hypothetical protein